MGVEREFWNYGHSDYQPQITARIVSLRREASGAWMLDIELDPFHVQLPEHDTRTIHPVRLDGIKVRAFQKGRKGGRA